jgi:hypothetical protein
VKVRNQDEQIIFKEAVIAKSEGHGEAKKEEEKHS